MSCAEFKSSDGRADIVIRISMHSTHRTICMAAGPFNYTQPDNNSDEPSTLHGDLYLPALAKLHVLSDKTHLDVCRLLWICKLTARRLYITLPAF